MRYLLPNDTTAYAPPVVTLLRNLREESLCFEKHYLMHPLDVFHSVFEEVVDSGIRLSSDVADTQRLFEPERNANTSDSQIRNGVFNFLFCIANFLDGCQSIIKSLSEDPKVLSAAQGEFKQSIRTYNDHVRKLVNYIKHRHRTIRMIYGKWDRNLIVGYFIEGVVNRGAIGPDPDIHKDSNAAISLNRDLPYHLINIYGVSAALGSILRKYGAFGDSEEASRRSNDEYPIKFIRQVANLPRHFFPDEIKMAWPEVKIKGDNGTQFEFLLPSKRKPENNRPHPLSISLTSKVRSKSRTLVLPYFRTEERQG
jgi:hypothetical protein